MPRIALLLLVLLLPLLASPATQYRVTSKSVGLSFVHLTLQYTGTDSFYVKEKSAIVKNLDFIIRCYGYYDFNFKIFDPLHDRYEVPLGGIFPFDPSAGSTFPINLAAFSFNYTDDPFSFDIQRRQDSSILFSTKDIDIIFSEYYIQIGTYTSSNLIYGFS